MEARVDRHMPAPRGRPRLRTHTARPARARCGDVGPPAAPSSEVDAAPAASAARRNHLATMTPTRLDVRPPLPPDVYLRRPAKVLPFPFGEPRARVFAKGRHAVARGALALGLVPGDDVLVPAYHHGSEVEALLQI